MDRLEFNSAEIAAYTIDATARMEQALAKLNVNKKGILFAVDAGGCVVGSVTDGDIRRRLLVDPDLNACIDTCFNRGFVHAPQGSDRESILKLLDNRIHTIPVLDGEGRLADVYSRERFRLEEEREVFSRARSPARISFGGGGTDLTRNFSESRGAVINATIRLYAHAALRRRADKSVRLYSHDLRSTVEADSVADLRFDGELDLLKAAIKLIEPNYGFDLEVAADFPVGSGLGGSAVVTAAIIGCFNEFRSDQWNRHQISEMAFQAERLMLSIPGGWQDQYATVFGGFNYMEFSADANEIVPLRIQRDVLNELEESLVLVFTGQTRNSGAVHASARPAAAYDERTAADRLKAITLEMRKRLLRGQLLDYGELLHDAWEAKRALHPGVSSAEFDQIYYHARENEAVGGKMLGAGRGGYFLFFVKPFTRMRFIAAMEAKGYMCHRVYFDDQGLQSWKVRVHD